jgi:folate-binding protein YgfZ
MPAHTTTHRIALGIPRGGVDFSYGDAFPHETDMDQLGGVDFAKGCYVGQEVVSRMEHRGIARTRAMPVRYDGAAPQAGVAVMAGERQVGTMGSAAAGAWARALAPRPRRGRARRVVSGFSPAVLRSGRSSRTGRALPFPDGSKAAE